MRWQVPTGHWLIHTPLQKHWTRVDTQLGCTSWGSCVVCLPGAWAGTRAGGQPRSGPPHNHLVSGIFSPPWRAERNRRVDKFCYWLSQPIFFSGQNVSYHYYSFHLQLEESQEHFCSFWPLGSSPPVAPSEGGCWQLIDSLLSSVVAEARNQR